MSIQQITEAEQLLATTLRNTMEVLQQVTTERDRLSALTDKWNLECDELREDNKRLAKELASLRDSGVELPKPKAMGLHRYNFTESQTRDYGDRRAMAERERILAMLEEYGMRGELSYSLIRKGE